MTLQPRTMQMHFVARMPERDAVVVVRQALGRAEEGYPLFPGTEAETGAAVVVLQERLRRLKARGIDIEGIELNRDIRRVLAGGGWVPLAS
jgi:hypothetical protein